MKKLLYFIVLGSLLSACGPQVTENPIESEGLFTPTAEATNAPEEAAAQLASEEALPAIAEAPIVESPVILNIEMMDEANGWALTEQNLIRTDDGGVTWYDVTPQDLREVGYFVYFNFLDTNHAWMQLPDMNNLPNGGTLYRTSDGGLTWEAFATPFSDGLFHFIDEQNGWMMANLGAGAGSNAVSIFKTRDGGETWERTYTNDPNLEGAENTLPLSGIKYFIVPLDVDTAWIGGVVYAPGETYLFRTDNSGATWSNINLVLPENVTNSDISMLGIVFVSQSDGLLALRITSDTPKTIVYRTANGGNTWEQLPIEFDGYGQLSTPSDTEMVFYMDSLFYVTDDAGATIQEVTPDVLFGDTIIDMNFVNARVGWVVTEDDNGRSLFRTEDGGATWTQQLP
ncbi:MAG: hypothetical protein H6635_10685 [Anaerolineales bacterium]|nr:hypothetical protein [Anaerolineales bacterium]MCB9145828.1 hypothetical protein [Anaerolineales bacterium]